MAAAQKRHLEISPAPQNQKLQRGFMIQVSLDGEILHKSLPLLEPFSSAEQADLRWYLEQYASQEPFNSDKARQVASSINTYAKSLHDQLKLGGTFRKHDPLVDEDHMLTIDVCERYAEDHDASLSLQSLHWELLEQLDLWSGFFSKVTVRRISPPRLHTGDPARTSSIQNAGTLNALIVIARNTEINPTAYQDVRPFAALDVLLRTRETLLQRPGAPQLHVEVVRPGTFDALKTHLKTSRDKYGAGFYHLIHLDMHGRVAKRRLASGDSVVSAWLDFASPGLASRPKPVPAESVAKLLAEHGIKCAILSACESARADQGLRANLAMTFLEKGVGNVLAMSYKFPSSVVESFFSTFYDGFLCHALPMSAAAAEARKDLREHGLRKSRFGLELQVQDWFIPVSYFSDQDILLSSARPAVDSSITHRDAERAAPRRKRITGRDFDLLRLEEAVTESNIALVHGPAGVGKSEFVKYAVEFWRDTGFFDKFSMVNMLACVADKELTGDKIISRIAKDLDLSDSLLVAGGSSTTGEVAGTRQGWRRAVVVLDGIDHIFNNVFNAGLKPVGEAVASLLRHLSSSEFADKQDKQVTFILTSRLGNEWWEARCPGPLVTPHYFELAGLELSAAITFAESLLQRRGIAQDKRGSRDTDFLVHIVNLLQRIPLAIKLALSRSTGADTPLEDVFRTIHVGDVELDLASLMYTPDYALILTLKEVYERFPEYQDTFCSLADFWIEGPVVLHRYIRDLAAYAGLSDVYDMSPVIGALNEVGVWRISEEDRVEWLHPVFTLYLRHRRRTHAYKGAPLWAKGIMKVADFLGSRKREHPFGSTASLQEAIPRHFVSAVGFRGKLELLADVLMSDISSSYAPDSMQRLRRSYFDLLTVLDMICRDDSAIPLELWPRDFIGIFLSASRLALSAPEMEMLTGSAEATMNVLLKRVGGYAVHPDFQILAFNLIYHMFVSSLFGGISDFGAAEQSIAQAVAIIEASEAKYGSMTGDRLMWKAMMYRCQAVFLIFQEDEAGAGAAWDRMKRIELEYFGPSAFQQSTFDPSSSSSGEPSAGANTLQNLLGSGGVVSSKLHRSIASWVPVRHAAWPLIKEQARSRGNTQALTQLYVPSIESAFENMVSSYQEAGWTGLEHWKRYYPPRNDLESYIRRAEEPEELLAQLEDGLGRGDWKIAAQAHQLLAKKALAEMKMDLAVFHLEQLSEILKEADPESAMVKQVTFGMGMINWGLEAMKRGFVADEDCLRLVDMAEAAGVDVKDLYRAQGLPEEFAHILLAAAERARNPTGSLSGNIIPLISSLRPPSSSGESDDEESDDGESDDWESNDASS